MNPTKKLLLRIADSANAAQAHYQIWFTLRGKDKALATYFETMDDYRFVDFFLANNAGHYKLMYIELGCAFDSDERAASIRELKKRLHEVDRHDLVELVERKFAPFKNLVRGVLTIRSQLIAHKELETDSKALYKKLGIIPDELGKLIGTLSSVVNEIHDELFEGSQVIAGETNQYERSTFAMLDALERGRT